MKKKTNRLVAYLCMPLIFTLIGVLLLLVLLQSPINSIKGTVGILIGSRPPEFVQEKKTSEINVSSVDFPAYGSFYANMYCERFSYMGQIYYGDSIRLLSKGIGQKVGSSLPGFGGTIVLYGNNNGAFWILEDMDQGDLIVIDTAYGEYEYEVTSAKIGYDDNDSELYRSDTLGEMLVMCTEYPFPSKNKTVEQVEEQADGTHKIIWAKKVSGPSVIN